MCVKYSCRRLALISALIFSLELLASSRRRLLRPQVARNIGDPLPLLTEPRATRRCRLEGSNTEHSEKVARDRFDPIFTGDQCARWGLVKTILEVAIALHATT